MIECLRTCVRKQPIIAIYFEFENELKFYNLRARSLDRVLHIYFGTISLKKKKIASTADPGVASWITAWSHTFVEIDHEIISMIILFLPLIKEGLLQKYVHKILVNRLVKLAQEKVWLGELTVST